MASVLAKVFDLAKSGQPVKLFKSHRDGVADGDQRRDFIYIDDAVSVLRWLLEATGINGIFNVGTGKAESFRDMIGAMFKALGAGEYRIHRYASGDPRTISIFHRGARRAIASRRI